MTKTIVQRPAADKDQRRKIYVQISETIVGLRYGQHQPTAKEGVVVISRA